MSKTAKKRIRRVLPPSGPHTNPRRKVSATPDEWSAWDAHCARLGTTWAEATRNLWRQIAPAAETTDGGEKPTGER